MVLQSVEAGFNGGSFRDGRQEGAGSGSSAIRMVVMVDVAAGRVVVVVVRRLQRMQRRRSRRSRRRSGHCEC